MENNFDIYQWNLDGRPCKKAFGSDAYNTGRHWKFAVDNYYMLAHQPTVLHIRGGGMVRVDVRYYKGPDWEWYQD